MVSAIKNSLFQKYSIFLLLSLSLVSILAGPFSGFLSVILLLTSGALIASKTPQQKLLTATLLPIVPSLVMQSFYFLDRAQFFTIGVVVVMVVINVSIAALSGFIGGLIPWYLNRKKNLQEIQREKKELGFKENLQRITASIVLFAFLLQTLIVPFSTTVQAESGTQVTSDEFIQNFDPENEYETSSKIILEQPKNRMPKDGLSSMSPEQLYEYCLGEGFAINVTECGQFTPPTPPVQTYEEGYWYSEPVIPNIVEQVYLKATGKKPSKTTKGKKLSTWEQILGFEKGVWDTGASFAGVLIKIPVQAAQWVYKNPSKALKSAGNLAWMNPVTWPVGVYKSAQWTWNNRVTISNTAVALKRAGDSYGWGNVAKAALFSPEAVKAWSNQEYGYALGRGMSEFALNIVTFIPPVAAAKVPIIGEKLSVAVNTVQKVNSVLTGASLIEHTAVGTSMVVRGGAKVLKTSVNAEDALAKAVRTESFVNVVETTVTGSVKAEMVTSTTKNVNRVDVLESALNIEKRAAQLAATDKAISKTSENIAKMYDTGKTYAKSFEHVNTRLKKGILSEANASKYISTVSKNRGVQVLVNDTARPEVIQNVSELASRGESKQLNSLNTLGLVVEQKGLKPIAVKTFADGTSEILTVDKKGKSLVHSMSSDGQIISKTYIPKKQEKDMYARAYASEGGLVSTAGKSSAKDGFQMAGGKNGGSSGSKGPFIVDQKALPKTEEESARVGSLIDPARSKPVKYTPKQLSDHEKANQYAKSGAHVQDRHIGKSDLELMIRAMVEGKATVSTYSNDAVYTRVVNEILNNKNNQKSIIEWLKSGKEKDTLEIYYESRDKSSLGRLYDNISKSYSESSVAVVVFKKRPDGKGYYILTSYVTK